MRSNINDNDTTKTQIRYGKKRYRSSLTHSLILFYSFTFLFLHIYLSFSLCVQINFHKLLYASVEHKPRINAYVYMNKCLSGKRIAELSKKWVIQKDIQILHFRCCRFVHSFESYGSELKHWTNVSSHMQHDKQQQQQWRFWHTERGMKLIPKKKIITNVYMLENENKVRWWMKWRKKCTHTECLRLLPFVLIITLQQQQQQQQ